MSWHLVRLLVTNGLIGAGAGITLAVGLVVFDAHGLGTLIAGSEAPLLPMVILTFGLVVTFASAAMGAAVMLLPGTVEAGRPGNGPGGGTPVPAVARLPGSGRR